MIDFIEELKECSIINKQEVLDLKEYINSKYPNNSEKANAIILAKTVHQIINKELKEIDDDLREEIRTKVIKETFLKSKDEILKVNILDVCIPLVDKTDNFKTQLTMWINANQSKSISEEVLEKYIEYKENDYSDLHKDITDNIEEIKDEKKEKIIDNIRKDIRGNIEKGIKNIETTAGCKNKKIKNITKSAEKKQNKNEKVKLNKLFINNKSIGYSHIKFNKNEIKCKLTKIKEVFDGIKKSLRHNYQLFSIKKLINKIGLNRLDFNKNLKFFNLNLRNIIISITILIIIIFPVIALINMKSNTASVAQNNVHTSVTKPKSIIEVIEHSVDKLVKLDELAEHPQLPAYFNYKKVKLDKLLNYLNKRNSVLAEEPYFSTIICTSKEFDLNPLILFAITGQEQGFVPKNHENVDRIANNPFNVYHSWQEYNTKIGDSTRIAAKTIIKLSLGRPNNEDPFKWINRKYAEDKNWSKGVKALYNELVEATK